MLYGWALVHLGTPGLQVERHKRYVERMIFMPFTKLQVWAKAVALAECIYAETKIFPVTEIYGMTAQMRRSAVSVPSNIAEGSQRRSSKDFANFVLIAKGSLAELFTQAVLARKLQYLSEEQAEALCEQIVEIDKMLFALSRKLTA